MTRSEFHAILYIYIHKYLGIDSGKLTCNAKLWHHHVQSFICEMNLPFCADQAPDALRVTVRNTCSMAIQKTGFLWLILSLKKRFLYVWNLRKWSWRDHQLCEINTSRSEITKQVKIEKHKNSGGVPGRKANWNMRCEKMPSVRKKHLVTWSLGMIKTFSSEESCIKSGLAPKKANATANDTVHSLCVNPTCAHQMCQTPWYLYMYIQLNYIDKTTCPEN